MGWFDGFPFKSKVQIEKERKDFQNKVLPLGIPQREKVRELLQEVMNPKLKDDEALFTYLCAKEAFVEQEDDEQGGKAALHSIHKQKWVSAEDKKKILALILLEKGIETLEEYPTAAMVNEKAEQLDGLA